MIKKYSEEEVTRKITTRPKPKQQTKPI